MFEPIVDRATVLDPAMKSLAVDSSRMMLYAGTPLITSQLPGIAPDMDLIQIATQPQLPANTIIDASHLAAVTVPVSLATTPVSVASTVPQCQHNGQDGHTHQLENGETKGTNLIVNYLPQTMSQEEIRSLFASIGDVESCKLIRDKVTGQSLGYGFVNYKNPTDAQKAINTLCGLRLQNKTIKVSQARPSCEGIKGANVYVCGLPKTFTQLDLESVFGQYGTIISSRILYDQITGLSKGVGFIRFDMRSEAEKAIDQLNGVIPKNATEKITVKFANNPSSKNPTLPLTIPATPYMSPMKKIVGPIHAPGRCFRFSPFEGAILANPLLAPTTAAAAAAAASTSSLLNSSANTGWCLFVYNLPPETEDNILWQLFGPIGAVQNVKVIRDLATQKCKGFGFVTMTNYEDACQAITTFNGYQLGERQLQVSFKSQTRKP